mmetsp:Transcript_20777/g.33763  ORF Transcript_20777/g.33763 Transcript_20777/m.33763 type:complete len:202 (+) Transcript_20777:342-947(+)
MRGGHEHFVLVPSGRLGAVIFVVVDGLLHRRVGIVIPAEGDGRTVGGGSIAERYVVSSYFEGGEGDVSFHVVAVALGGVDGIVQIGVSVLVALEGVGGIVHAGNAGPGIETGMDVIVARVRVRTKEVGPRPSQVGTAETTRQPGRTAGTTAVDAFVQRGLDLIRIVGHADAAVPRSSQAVTAEIARGLGLARITTVHGGPQ